MYPAGHACTVSRSSCPGTVTGEGLVRVRCDEGEPIPERLQAEVIVERRPARGDQRPGRQRVLRETGAGGEVTRMPMLIGTRLGSISLLAGAVAVPGEDLVRG